MYSVTVLINAMSSEHGRDSYSVKNLVGESYQELEDERYCYVLVL